MRAPNPPPRGRGARPGGAGPGGGLGGYGCGIGLASRGLEVAAQGAELDGVVPRDDQHHREGPAEDRHLRVLDVQLMVEEVARDGGDDSGPVPADGGNGEVTHAAQHRTAAEDQAARRVPGPTTSATSARSPATSRYSTLRSRPTRPTRRPAGSWIPICAPT